MSPETNLLLNSAFSLELVRGTFQSVLVMNLEELVY